MPFAALSWLPACSQWLCGKVTRGWRSRGGFGREAQTLLYLVFPSLPVPSKAAAAECRSVSQHTGQAFWSERFFRVKGFSDGQEQWMSLSLGQ